MLKRRSSMIFAGGLLVLVDVSDSGCGDYLSDIANKSAARQARTQHTHTHTRTRAHTNTHEGLIQGMLWSTLASESRGVRAGSESLPSHTVQRGGGGRGCVATRSSWSRAGAGRCWIFCLRVGWGGGGEAAVGRVPHHLATLLESQGGIAAQQGRYLACSTSPSGERKTKLATSETFFTKKNNNVLIDIIVFTYKSNTAYIDVETGIFTTA